MKENPFIAKAKAREAERTAEIAPVIVETVQGFQFLTLRNHLRHLEGLAKRYEDAGERNKNVEAKLEECKKALHELAFSDYRSEEVAV